MRLWIGVAAAAFLAVSPAAAQTDAAAPQIVSRCGEFPAPPELIDTTNARVEQVNRTTEAVVAWQTAITAINNCRNEEATAMSSQLNGILERNRSDAQTATTLIQTWQAQVEAFTASNESRSRNRLR